MTKKHFVFIINPNSGIDRQKEIQNAIDKYFDLEKFTYEICHTQYAKHGTTIAREAAANGAFCVVAVGGDGSINDIVIGLMGTKTILGVIPKGSGNGLARTLRIPLNTAEAIKLLNRGNHLALDVCFANDQPFISNAGVAFDALIAKKFASSKTRGLWIYTWLITKHLWNYESWEWEIKVDGKEIKEKAFIVNVANGEQLGYNFKLAPWAVNSDGLMELVIIKKFPKLFCAFIAARAMTGTIKGSPFLRSFTGKEIVIKHPSLRLIQTDGDAHATEKNEIKFTVKKGAQLIFVP